MCSTSRFRNPTKMLIHYSNSNRQIREDASSGPKESGHSLIVKIKEVGEEFLFKLDKH
jgi:hypothetical protein